MNSVASGKETVLDYRIEGHEIRGYITSREISLVIAKY
jgi:hypothetical protein